MTFSFGVSMSVSKGKVFLNEILFNFQKLPFLATSGNFLGKGDLTESTESCIKYLSPKNCAKRKLGSKINILLQKMALNLERNENYAPESKMGCNLGPWRVVFANIYMPLTSRICTQQTLKLLTIEQTNINFLLARNSNSPCHFRNRVDG